MFPTRKNIPNNKERPNIENIAIPRIVFIRPPHASQAPYRSSPIPAITQPGIIIHQIRYKSHYLLLNIPNESK